MGLQDDGDVWEAIDRMIRKRGPHGTLASKVKGHADDEDVERGISTDVDRAGNNAADEAASAAKTHASWRSMAARARVIELLDFRWEQAKSITKEVQSMMLSIVDATRSARTKMVDTAAISYTHRKALVEIHHLPTLPDD